MNDICSCPEHYGNHADLCFPGCGCEYDEQDKAIKRLEEQQDLLLQRLEFLEIAVAKIRENER